MPAFTIAAECKYADTGVGAAIAPGNQICHGACADFVIAPNIISTIAVEIAGVFSIFANCDTSLSRQMPVL